MVVARLAACSLLVYFFTSIWQPVEAQKLRSFNLTVTVSGAGRVISDLPGIDCPGACQAKFNSGTTITLTATPEGGAVFNGWGGDCAVGSEALQCTVSSLSRNTSISASFGSGGGGGGTTIEQLEARIAELESIVASLSSSLNGFEEQFSGVSRNIDPATGFDTLRFSGMNVQIVSGLGWTDGVDPATRCSGDGCPTFATNGLGNLIIGYNENLDDLRTGSHNLVVGERHSYDGYGSLIGGFDNYAGGSNVAVLGARNTASGAFASALGGVSNTSRGAGSSVVGGLSNTLFGSFFYTYEWLSYSPDFGDPDTVEFGTIVGGIGNEVGASAATVVGGYRNLAGKFGRDIEVGNLGIGSVVVGGHDNQAIAYTAVVVGGSSNQAGEEVCEFGCWTWGANGVVLGGTRNLLNSDSKTIVGGDDVVCDLSAQGDFGQSYVCGEGSFSPVD